MDCQTTGGISGCRDEAMLLAIGGSEQDFLLDPIDLGVMGLEPWDTQDNWRHR